MDGISPNVFVILFLCIGLFAGKRVGIPLGVICGICLDFWMGKQIGISSIMLGTIGALGGVLDKNFSKDSRMTIILMTLATTFLYEMGTYILQYIMMETSFELIPFLKIVIVEMIYNGILVIILYPLLQRAGYAIEEVFREKKILTRYF